MKPLCLCAFVVIGMRRITTKTQRHKEMSMSGLSIYLSLLALAQPIYAPRLINLKEMSEGIEEAIAEALRDLASWLYRVLEREFDHQTSDEVVDEMIAVNGYTFTADGRRFG